MIAARGDGNCAVVLLRAVDVVGIPIVGDDVVELRGRLIILPRPGGAAVHAHVRAAVIGVDHAAGIRGIDPQAVMVAMRRGNYGEGFAGIVGAIHAGIEDIHRVRALGIGEDVRVIPGALADATLVIHQAPVVAAVV